jgi:hypothetical protein
MNTIGISSTNANPTISSTAAEGINASNDDDEYNAELSLSATRTAVSSLIAEAKLSEAAEVCKQAINRYESITKLSSNAVQFSVSENADSKKSEDESYVIVSKESAEGNTHIDNNKTSTIQDQSLGLKQQLLSCLYSMSKYKEALSVSSEILNFDSTNYRAKQTQAEIKYKLVRVI